MPLPDHLREPVAHVERTDDAAVLRWVCSEPSLAQLAPGVRRPPRGDALAQLLEQGVLVEMAVVGDAFVVRARDASAWVPLAPVVHASLMDALRTHASWLFEPADAAQATVGAVSVAAVQRVVDGAAGVLTGAHGGAIEVVAVADGTVVVQLSGACHGCRFTHDTLRRVVMPAVQRAFPQLTVALEQ